MLPCTEQGCAHTDCSKQRQELQFTRVLICSFPRLGSVCVRLGLMGTLVVGVLSKLLKYLPWSNIHEIQLNTFVI